MHVPATSPVFVSPPAISAQRATMDIAIKPATISMPRHLRRMPLAVCLGIACAATAHEPMPQVPDPAAVHPFGSRMAMLARLRSPEVTHGSDGWLAAGAASHEPRHIAAPSGTTITVTNCDDSGAGSLRGAVSVAMSGDTIDLASLPCSTITLETGAIVIAQNDLTLIGPGALQLAVDGGARNSVFDRVFDHSGTGSLAISYLTITDATYATYAPDGAARGGCIRSEGSVALLLSIVSSCRIAQGGKNIATGGGVWASTGLTLVASIVRDNVAYSPDGGSNVGGAGTFGALTAKYSTITNNTAYYIGGLFGDSTGDPNGNVIEKTTISGNHANLIGGVAVSGDNASTVRDSTISGNRGSFVIGGIVAGSPIHLHNSTVAFNEAGGTVSGTDIFDVGLVVTGAFADLQSSIVANNRVDLSDIPRDVSLRGTGFIAGNSNLVTFTDAEMPIDTIYADPLLHPLSVNDGFTRTHALMDASPAIDTGNNTAGLTYDQRLMPRVVGANADIGAFERQGPGDSDYIFVDGFD